MTITQHSASQPLGELNTTPLIDVLLVLLILFVITIPAASHSIELDLPQGPSPAPLNPLLNKVLVTGDNQVLWNGAMVSQSQLAGLIAATRRLPVEPQLQFDAEATAHYDLAAQTVRTIKLAGAESLGLIGTERHASFGKAD